MAAQNFRKQLNFSVKGFSVSCCHNDDFITAYKDTHHKICKKDFQNQSSIACAQVMLFLCSPFTFLYNPIVFLNKSAFPYPSYICHFSIPSNFKFPFLFHFFLSSKLTITKAEHNTSGWNFKIPCYLFILVISAIYHIGYLQPEILLWNYFIFLPYYPLS